MYVCAGKKIPGKAGSDLNTSLVSKLLIPLNSTHYHHNQPQDKLTFLKLSTLMLAPKCLGFTCILLKFTRPFY